MACGCETDAMRFIRHVVVFDAADVAAESAFWAELLGGQVVDEADERFRAVQWQSTPKRRMGAYTLSASETALSRSLGGRGLSRLRRGSRCRRGP